MPRSVAFFAVLVVARAAVSQWSAPVRVALPNATARDSDPAPSVDGLTLWYSSNQTGDQEIYQATRAARSLPFGSGIHVAEVGSTTSYEGGPTVRADGLELFFHSDRAGTHLGFNLWRATRATPVSRFTGTLGNGVATPYSARALRFSDPDAPGRLYVAMSSSGTTPGIGIDTRVIPLNPDALLALTLGGLPPILTGFVGFLDPEGVAAGRMDFAGFPELVGLRLHTGFLVLDAQVPPASAPSATRWRRWCSSRESLLTPP